MSTPQRYYSVRYHPSSDELGLPPDREFVFPGLFLAWLAINDLLSQEFVQLVGADEIARVKDRIHTGPQLLQYVDGIIDSAMVTEKGHRFSEHYFDLLNGGEYMSHFKSAFHVTGNMPKDLYQVADTWENYERLALSMDAAFAAWMSHAPR